MMYAFSENYVLAISHDEVVHGKASLIGKMAGDHWQRRANLRLLLGYQWAQSGKKLLFMGCEIGQWKEWNHDSSLDWHLLQYPEHFAIKRWVSDLNALYKNIISMHELDCDPTGFEWVDCNDAQQSVVSFLRFAKDREDPTLVVCNFTPVPRPAYGIGVPQSERWEEVLNSDDVIYGGSGWGKRGVHAAEPVELHGRACSITIDLPPLSIIFLRPVRDPELQRIGVESDPEAAPLPDDSLTAT
jgi:1,4-alpha-glucan branching enzyme